eukprot:6180400-Pleurochrysis_carterae.AAC.1
MNAARADSVLALMSATAAALRDARGMGEFDCFDNARDVTVDLCDMCDAGAVAAYGLIAHGKNNQTWAYAMKSVEANHWRDAARLER